MTIVSLDPATGQLERRVPIAKAVPGASSGYGYSETSAPICANHRLIVGAAGSEYGVRGFVMAYKTDLTPAWPNPFWTIPPTGTGWRRNGTLVGGGVVWTPTTVDTTTNTLYFGTGSATPLYFPSIRPGSNPRADSLIAVNLATGRMRWWQQQMAHNEWSYDTAQPPLVYTAKVGGKKQRIVSVGTMEGVWFAYDAKTGRPIYQRVKVIDRSEHPPLRPGVPVTVFPSSLGGLNYSPASFDPATNYIFNGAAETAAIDVQTKLTPTQKKRKFTLGDVFLGLENGNFGTILPGWHDHGSISAIDVNTGRQAWKFTTPEPERGGITTTDSGLGFAGGGDGVLRAFDLKSGKVSGRSRRATRSRAALALLDRRQGVPRDHGRRDAHLVRRRHGERAAGIRHRRLLDAVPAAAASARAPDGEARVGAARCPRAPSSAAGLRLDCSARRARRARLAGEFVERRPRHRARPAERGACRRRACLARPLSRSRATAKDGSFQTDVDITIPLRRVVRVVGATKATVHGRALTAGQRSALARGVRRLQRRVRARAAESARGEGQRRSHRAAGGCRGPGAAARPASDLPAHGHDHRRGREARAGRRRDHAHAGPRLLDAFVRIGSERPLHVVLLGVGRDERRSGASQRRRRVGGVSYGGVLGTNVPFKRLRSAVMNIQLGAGTNYTIQTPSTYVGAVYTGLVVGVTAGGKVVKPLAARWPDAHGTFSITLPASVRGKTLHFWENARQFFSRFAARPGGAIDLTSWPTALGDAVPVGLASLKAP